MLPEELQFLRPDRANRDALRHIGYRFVDAIVDEILDGLERPFVKDETPLALNFDRLDRPADPTEILAELKAEILPRSLNLHATGYLGHMDSVPMAVSIWADAVVAALNNNMLSVELAPALSQMEAQLTAWFGRLFGLGDASFGTMTAGGSVANLTALQVARTRSVPPGCCDRAVAFVSDAAHVSFEKAAKVLGLGAGRLARVPTDARGQMIPEALEAALQRARAAGQHPFFVAAIAGTTVTGAVDDLPAMAAIAKRYGCWFHVDAAYGGAAALSPRWQHLLQGCDRADSVTFNPQKWMWVSRTCAMALFRDRQHLADAFDVGLPYMASHPLNYGTLNLQGTRRTDSLKLWLCLRSLGKEGYARLIDRSMDLARGFRRWAETQLEVALACEPTLNIVCLRAATPEVDLFALRQHWMAERGLWLSVPHWKGDRVLKAVVLHPHADRCFAAANG